MVTHISHPNNRTLNNLQETENNSPAQRQSKTTSREREDGEEAEEKSVSMGREGRGKGTWRQTKRREKTEETGQMQS